MKKEFLVGFTAITLTLCNAIGLGVIKSDFDHLKTSHIPKVVYVAAKTESDKIANEVYRKAFNATVAIITENEQSKGIGTGFFITEDGLILTAKHVITDAKTITVIFQETFKFEAEVVKVSPNKDLAVLKIKDPNFKEQISFTPLKLQESKEIFVGKRAFILGYPHWLPSLFTVGYVSRLEDPAMFGNNLILNMQGNPGDSGSAVLDNEGKVIGVFVAILDPYKLKNDKTNTGISMAVSVSDIVNFLKS